MSNTAYHPCIHDGPSSPKHSRLDSARSSSVSSRPLGIISVIECIEVKSNCDRVYTVSVILSDVYITVKAIVILSLDFSFSTEKIEKSSRRVTVF